MAQYQQQYYGSFDKLLAYVDQAVMNGSISATREGGSDMEYGGVRCAVRVYERYSMLGGNRLSLSVTLFGTDKSIQMTAITAGGSQAIRHKINRWGENNFMNKFIQQMEQYRP